jgi:hypothetical protein
MQAERVQRFLKLFREEFYAAVSRKTGWGSQELKLEFERCAANALTQVLDEPEHQ